MIMIIIIIIVMIIKSNNGIQERLNQLASVFDGCLVGGKL